MVHCSMHNSSWQIKTRTSSSLERARFLAEVSWLSSARFWDDMLVELSRASVAETLAAVRSRSRSSVHTRSIDGSVICSVLLLYTTCTGSSAIVYSYDIDSLVILNVHARNYKQATTTMMDNNKQLGHRKRNYNTRTIIIDIHNDISATSFNHSNTV